eukprot:tig00021012_g16995.t1
MSNQCAYNYSSTASNCPVVDDGCALDTAASKWTSNATNDGVVAVLWRGTTCTNGTASSSTKVKAPCNALNVTGCDSANLGNGTSNVYIGGKVSITSGKEPASLCVKAGWKLTGFNSTGTNLGSWSGGANGMCWSFSSTDSAYQKVKSYQLAKESNLRLDEAPAEVDDEPGSIIMSDRRIPGRRRPPSNSVSIPTSNFPPSPQLLLEDELALAALDDGGAAEAAEAALAADADS